tara:strand:- start:974 stop:1087 length:114 start_codon:yes stop_codon:yes gene_type:complete
MADKNTEEDKFSKPDSQPFRAFLVQKKRKKRKKAAEE